MQTSTTPTTLSSTDHPSSPHPSSAFSLIELSLVLVILGLLTGGILAGQSLIRAAELRAVTTEHQRHVTATQSFRDRYMALPGDMREATRFWQRQSAAACTTNITPAPAVNAATGTCDGNGDGRLSNVAAANTSSELFQFWRQLALAGLIEGDYSGLSGAHASGHQAVLGTNVPDSHVGNAGWAANYFTSSAAGEIFNIRYSNVLYFGAATGGSLTAGSILKPEELWIIDMKMDDGRPGRGKLIARNISTCTTAGAGAGSENNLDADYLLTSSSIGCAIHFPEAF